MRKGSLSQARVGDAIIMLSFTRQQSTTVAKVDKEQQEQQQQQHHEQQEQQKQHALLAVHKTQLLAHHLAFLWMAPELLGTPPDPCFSGSAVDIYALGIVMSELLSLQPPWRFKTTTKNSKQAILSSALLGRRPRVSPKGGMAPAGFERLMKRCWRQDASARPSPTMAARILQNVFHNLVVLLHSHYNKGLERSKPGRRFRFNTTPSADRIPILSAGQVSGNRTSCVQRNPRLLSMSQSEPPHRKTAL